MTPRRTATSPARAVGPSFPGGRVAGGIEELVESLLTGGRASRGRLRMPTAHEDCRRARLRTAAAARHRAVPHSAHRGHPARRRPSRRRPRLQGALRCPCQRGRPPWSPTASVRSTDSRHPPRGTGLPPLHRFRNRSRTGLIACRSAGRSPVSRHRSFPSVGRSPLSTAPVATGRRLDPPGTPSAESPLSHHGAPASAIPLAAPTRRLTRGARRDVRTAVAVRADVLTCSIFVPAGAPCREGGGKSGTEYEEK
jgi:hypothetical protein